MAEQHIGVEDMQRWVLVPDPTPAPENRYVAQTEYREWTQSLMDVGMPPGYPGQLSNVQKKKVRHIFGVIDLFKNGRIDVKGCRIGANALGVWSDDHEQGSL